MGFGAKPISMARYMIDQRRDARAQGRSLPDQATLRSQYNQTYRPQPQPTSKTPMVSPQPTGNFQGDTSVPNLNTIGAPAPTTGGFNTPTGQFDASTAPPLPPGAVYKKGGYISKDGKLNLGSGRVSTTSKNKSNSNW